MNKKDMNLFLQRKGGLLAARARDPNTRKFVEVVLPELAKLQEPPQAYVVADKELQQFIACEALAIQQEIARTLKEEFGFSRLEERPQRVIAKIIKRGSIVAEREAEVVNDALSGDYGELPDATMKKLGQIFAAYGRENVRTGG